jgi:hypothetical protein
MCEGEKNRGAVVTSKAELKRGTEICNHSAVEEDEAMLGRSAYKALYGYPAAYCHDPDLHLRQPYIRTPFAKE